MNLIDSNRYKMSLRKIKIDKFQRKTIVVTGATGMIGSCLVDVLMQYNKGNYAFCNVVAIGRNIASAKNRFGVYWEKPGFLFLQQDINKPIVEFSNRVDYIIHAASYADPINYAQKPVDTVMTNVLGTSNLLYYGIAHGMSRFAFISSGEMYGQPNKYMDDFVEDYVGPIDYSSPRACYPSGKRTGEVLCQSFIGQYHADAVIVRPCHIFGPTMTRNDSRAVSEFLRNAVVGKDIVMKSAGLVERSHCYVLDTVQAILFTLLYGKCGEAYNIADKKYQMKICDFAQQAAAAGGCHVIYGDPSDSEKSGYSKVTRSVLSADKLLSLGWIPNCANGSAIEETITILREINY